MIKKIVTDVLVIGGGAAGLMCALTSGYRGRQVMLVDHANRMGKKILMSGGGKCNFTNYEINFHNYLSENPHFCKSALKRYTSTDFIELVERHSIPFHEKKHGQLFCDNKSKDILDMLFTECDYAGVIRKTHVEIYGIDTCNTGYLVNCSLGIIQCESLVIASGGLSIPTMGATGFGYKIAEQIGHQIIKTRAGLVPFIFTGKEKEVFSQLSGLSLPVKLSTNNQSFSENLLFTHRGLSGPAVLQISSYWQLGDKLTVNWLASSAENDFLKHIQQNNGKSTLKNSLQETLPNRFVENYLSQSFSISKIPFQKKLAEISRKNWDVISEKLINDHLLPAGTEGYRTAEVTLGGVSTKAISSQTMESELSKGLYFIGEVVDVTGHLGGYNFQWAWSSGYAAGSVA
ncbi:MAG: NAD(P)/FAD-dependent oxidoreductase [Pseudomonadota bacterium]